MKIQVNGTVSIEALSNILEEQKQKVEAIDLFCKQKQIQTLFYKDSILEYEYVKQNKKVEVRPDAKGNETR